MKSSETAELCRVCGGSCRPAMPGLLRCNACGLVFLPRRTFVPATYPPGSEAVIYSSAKERIFSDALDTLGTPGPGGRLLDIGCAAGEFLCAAAARGWKARGVELDPRLASAASSKGFDVVSVPVESAGLKGGDYEAVTAFEVFSQMEAPELAAGEAARILKPGGTLYMREFNSGFHLALYWLERCGFFAVLGISPYVVHNFNFNACSLRALLEKSGFRDIRIRNSRPTSGDPYRTGGRLGGFLTGLLKVLYYWLAQALWAVSFGRVFAGSSLIITARK